MAKPDIAVTPVTFNAQMFERIGDGVTTASAPTQLGFYEARRNGDEYTLVYFHQVFHEIVRTTFLDGVEKKKWFEDLATSHRKRIIESVLSEIDEDCEQTEGDCNHVKEIAERALYESTENSKAILEETRAALQKTSEILRAQDARIRKLEGDQHKEGVDRILEAQARRMVAAADALFAKTGPDADGDKELLELYAAARDTRGRVGL